MERCRTTTVAIARQELIKLIRVLISSYGQIGLRKVNMLAYIVEVDEAADEERLELLNHKSD